MSDDSTVYIVSACRTPIGSLGGALKTVSAHELGSIVIKECLLRAALEVEGINEVIMGQCLTAGQGPNPARLASLRAGIPETVPAFTVNMLCGSGLKAIYLAYQSIKAGESYIVVAGGQENMSMAHHSALLRPGFKLGHAPLHDTILTDGLIDVNLHMHMGDTAEHLAQKHTVSRHRQDEFALKSQTKTHIAMENGYFDDEIVPVHTKNGKNNLTVDEDEFPKRETTLEGLAKLKPVFSGRWERSVTAGNSSGINDGAAAVILVSGIELKIRSFNPIAKIVAFAQSGVLPVDMGLGPIDAIRNLMNKTGWSLNDVDLFEINEAFAVQSIIVANELKIPEEKLNVSGGAIALGHPIGCSGARVLVTLLYNLHRLEKNRGVASLCIGGGMGIAIAVERC